MLPGTLGDVLRWIHAWRTLALGRSWPGSHWRDPSCGDTGTRAPGAYRRLGCFLRDWRAELSLGGIGNRFACGDTL